ncbi:hypothetical protein GQX74_004648 [Glossina fuscipes]|nr:hypothetical protein GQX74_004648 [Glossina fuscipes]
MLNRDNDINKRRSAIKNYSRIEDKSSLHELNPSVYSRLNTFFVIIIYHLSINSFLFLYKYHLTLLSMRYLYNSSTLSEDSAYVPRAFQRKSKAEIANLNVIFAI